MKKRLIPIIIAIVYSLNILPTFAEYEVDEVYAEIENDLLASEESGIIDISEITEDNVLFQSMQNKQPSHKFGLRKAGRKSTDADTTEISADFDIVMNFDMSSDMYDFDVNGDKEWLEDFKAIAEQAPDNTRYAVVPSDTEGFTYDLETSINDVQCDSYTGESDIVTMLDDSVAAFDDNSDNRNKVVIATTQIVEDVDELEDKLDGLRNDDIIPFVFVLNEETDSSLDIDGVYQCATDLELRLAVSDLYLSLEEFKIASNASNNNVVLSEPSVANDYKPKHKFGNVSSVGEALISVLNMYGCVPMMANVKNYTTDGNGQNIETNYSYDILDMDTTAVVDFINADNEEFSKKNVSNLVEAWDELFNGLADKYTSATNVEDILDKNLKRRFPVFVFKYTGEQISDLNIVTNYETLDDNIYIFDTYEYLMDTIRPSIILHDKIRYSDGITIETRYPTSYNILLGTNVKRLSIDNQSTVSLNETVPWHIEDSSNLIISTQEEREFVVGTTVTYTNGKPNIVNANKRYHTRMYNDINDSHWAYDFISKATNKGIITGFPNGTFLPDNSLTRGQFVLMALRAAEIVNADNTSLDETYIGISDNHLPEWVRGYMNYALNKGIIDLNKYMGDGYAQELTRGEAAEIIYKLFVENANEVQVPINIINYENINTYKTERWKNHTAFEEQTMEDSASFNGNQCIEQMYYNGVLDGMYGEGEDVHNKIYFYPDNILTRAQGCKIVLKPLFDLDDAAPILVNIYGSEFEDTTTGTEVRDSFGESGIKRYRITVDPDGLYSEYNDKPDGTDIRHTGGRLYKLSTVGTDIHYTLYDESGLELQQDENSMYRLKSRQVVTLVLEGNPNSDFGFVMNDCWAPGKKNYVVLNDSYDEQFQEILGDGVTSRYHNSQLANYEYNKEFFKTYFELLGNRQTAFDIGVRDLYFDATTKYSQYSQGQYYKDDDTKIPLSELKFAEDGEEETYLDRMVSRTSEKYINIINYMYSAIDELNINRIEKIPYPEIYLGSPHLDRYGIRQEDGGWERDEEFAGIYSDAVKKIYNNVASICGEDKITGLDFGREDPDGMLRGDIYDDGDYSHYSISYNAMRKISTFIHNKGKKMLWIPYSSFDGTDKWKHIGEVANNGKDESGRDVLDVIVIQPGLFYSNDSSSLSSYGTDSIRKQRKLKTSVEKQEIVNDLGETILAKIGEDITGGTVPTQKTTSTEIALQIEYDISLVTGRAYPKGSANPIAYPIDAATNFVKTYIIYKDIIYDEKLSFGLYPGGPNEQDYKNVAGINNNRHSIINHPSAMSQRINVGDQNYINIDYGNDNAYNSFFESLSSSYFYNQYNNRLIYDITKGLLFKMWNVELKRYLNMDSLEKSITLPDDFSL